MKMTPDLELLRDYATKNSEKAFAAVVARHVDLVFSTALRQVKSSQLAEEISQSVFIDLAKNVTHFKPDTILAAWLYHVTRRTALNVSRTEARRHAREQIAVELAAMNATSTNWTQIEPQLDDAMEALDETDRAAILLRYFENKSLREVGRELGIGDDAAQKRVSRAVERLREIFSKRNVTIGASGLVVLISANAVQAAPATLIPLISTAISLAGTATQTSGAIATTKLIVMTALQKTIVGATLAVAVGTGIYEMRENSRLRAALAASEKESAMRIHALQTTHDSETADLLSENQRLKKQAEEILKLRSEVGQLRQTAASKNLSQPETRTATKENPIREVNLPKTAWVDSGFATPEDALKTRGWAVLNGDREKFKESMVITDGARKILLDMFAKMSAAKPDEAKYWTEQSAKNGWGIEEGFLMPMVAENRDKTYTGYRILSQESASPDEAVLQVETQMIAAPAKQEVVKMRRFGSDWKFLIDEDFLQKMTK